ncbi:MAG: biotin/lipoyl-binding protein [Candidatus Delongbacteria bacterium]|nr:biotin/lipoyl-binding protein [Candidatus Delongbacteria bacterium]
MKEIKLDINGKEYTVKINEFGSKEATLEVNGKKYVVGLKDLGKELNLGSVSEVLTPLATSDPIQSAPKTNTPSTGGSGEVLSPLPGLILNVIVSVGDKVKDGQNIMIMEAMKMENDIIATKDGVIKSINVKNGDNISEGDVLAIIE